MVILHLFVLIISLCPTKNVKSPFQQSLWLWGSITARAPGWPVHKSADGGPGGCIRDKQIEVEILLSWCHHIIFPVLRCDLCLWPPLVLKTNNLLLMLTPCHFRFIPTFPVRGSLSSLELQFSQHHLPSPPLGPQSNVHSQGFVLIALLPSFCWLVLYRDKHRGRKTYWVSPSWWMDCDGVRCRLNCVLARSEIAKTHPSEFHCYFNLRAALLWSGDEIDKDSAAFGENHAAGLLG